MNIKFMVGYKTKPLQPVMGGYNSSNFTLFDNVFNTEDEAKKQIKEILDLSFKNRKEGEHGTIMFFIMPCYVSEDFKYQ